VDRLAILLTPLGPRFFDAAAAARAIEMIGSHWGEDRDPRQDPVYLALAAQLAGESGAMPQTWRIKGRRSGQFSTFWRWLSQQGEPFGHSAKTLPARYINVSQFPIWSGLYRRWLEARRDFKPIFFIHDLLPIEHPEFFRLGERQRHRARLANVAHLGAGVIVASALVKAALDDHMRAFDRTDLPILAAPVPSVPIFSAPLDQSGECVPYFVCCGTIEPRKNHLLLLNVWRELVAREAPPKLVLVGARGWKYRPFVELLEHSPALRAHVIEVGGLTTPALHRLLAGARALLMPSFAEGFGLPVHEALTTGIPVLASDIPAFREIVDERLLRLSPTDPQAWLTAIENFLRKPIALRVPRPATSWQDYFAEIETFIGEV